MPHDRRTEAPYSLTASTSPSTTVPTLGGACRHAGHQPHSIIPKAGLRASIFIRNCNRSCQGKGTVAMTPTAESPKQSLGPAADEYLGYILSVTNKYIYKSTKCGDITHWIR